MGLGTVESPSKGHVGDSIDQLFVLYREAVLFNVIGTSYFGTLSRECTLCRDLLLYCITNERTECVCRTLTGKFKLITTAH